LSSEVNGKFNAITTLLNTTGLDSTNVQVGGLNRNRLTTDTAYAVVANDSLGVMTVATPLTNTAIYYNSLGRVTVGALPALAGGTGLQYTLTSLDAAKVIQVNSSGTALTIDTSPQPPTLKVYSYYRFT
jgi:hypothetical protein